MIFLKLLLRSLIYIAAIAIGDPTDEVSENTKSYLSNYISKNVMPIHYKVQFKFISDFLFGECEIIIYIMNATQHIGFHIPFPMSIIRSDLKQINNNVPYEAKQELDSIYDDTIMLHYDEVLLHGIYILYIRFHIPIEYVTDTFATLHIGRYEIVHRNTEEWVIITGAQTKRQQILPFWNKPDLRISFDISIMHDQRYKALSNMPIRESKLMEDNMMLTYFYKAFFTIDEVVLMESSFHRINLNSATSMWCRSKLIPYVKFALHVAENVTIYLEKYWNNSKKILESTLLFTERKVDHVVISDLKDEVKQTLGFVFYREADIIYDEELDLVASKMRIARLIAREMIQKYIGNLLNPSYWFHQRLNEGFIMYLQEYIIEEALPNSRMMDLFIVQVQHELLDLNSYIAINFAVECNTYPENYYSSLSFLFLSSVKASIIWRMLERTLPPNIFFMGINKYLNNQFNDRKATTSDHLWNAMQSMMIELDFNYKLKSIMDSWAMQRRFPILDVMRDYSRNVVIISVQFNNTLDEEQYYIPVTYTTESNLNFIITCTNIWLTPSDSKIEFFLEKNQWIIFNLQQAGYYRVYYDTENWRKIARYLNSEEYENIHVLNRAQIIDDAFHFAIEKKLDFSIFWELANYLSREKEYIVWYPMIKAFEFLSHFIPLLEFYPDFKEKLKFEFLERNIQFLPWNLYTNSGNDHTKCLKQELAKWKCIITNNTVYTKWATNNLEWHLLNRKENKLLPGWKSWIYCNGLKMADRNIWEKILQNYIKTDHIILECLACVKDPEIIINYLEIKLPQILYYYPYHFKLIQQDFNLNANIFLFTLARNIKYMLKDLLNNFKKIKHREVNDIVTLIVMINNVYSKDQLDEIFCIIVRY
ncbi:aminopeptidase N-like isoform X2 [Camponotus floridanus]|uniref:aminopeptidase N-like isoform X2 n=1 Tax=Camponotus floridanus TaxID=104421 RepID=UPI000DC67679|nr:aminopeptidase N-like isoform X2 [Camponotus floridanus]